MSKNLRWYSIIIFFLSLTIFLNCNNQNNLAKKTNREKPKFATHQHESTRTIPKSVEDLLACALLVAKRIENSTDRAYALCEIAVRYAEARQYDKAIQIVETREIAIFKNSALSDIANSALSDIAIEYAKAGQYNQALQVAEIIESTYKKASTLSKIARQKGKSSKILDQAFQVAKTIEDDVSRFNALSDIAVKYAETGQYNQALQVVKRIEDSSRSSSRAYALCEIAVRYAEARQYDKAIQIAKTIKDDFYKSDALSHIGVAGGTL